MNVTAEQMLDFHNRCLFVKEAAEEAGVSQREIRDASVHYGITVGSAAVAERCVELHDKGFLAPEIAEVIGRDERTVYRHLSRHDRTHPHATIVPPEEAVKLLNKGWTRVAIADKYQVCETSVSRALQRAGVPVEPPPIKGVQRARVVKLWEEHGSVKQVARELQVAESTVRHHLQMAGVEFTSRRSYPDTYRRVVSLLTQHPELTTREIAVLLGRSRSCISQHRKRARARGVLPTDERRVPADRRGKAA